MLHGRAVTILFFSTAVLTLNFDIVLYLSRVKVKFGTDFMKIGLVVFEQPQRP